MTLGEDAYERNTQLTTVLVLGTDTGADSDETGKGFRAGGQADFLLLVVVDDEAKTVRTIQIDRDTIADVTTLGVLGDETGIRRTQICLAHSFGDGKEQSCRCRRMRSAGCCRAWTFLIIWR
jgi:hypothetical protein